jgi:hypothetical protein
LTKRRSANAPAMPIASQAATASNAQSRCSHSLIGVIAMRGVGGDGASRSAAPPCFVAGAQAWSADGGVAATQCYMTRQAWTLQHRMHSDKPASCVDITSR